MSLSARPRRRRGFTLIEMLVVITIIGMLMSMTSFAVWKVMSNAKVAKIAVEIDQLAQAMNGYKQTRIQYPPCMGTTTLTDRKVEFLRHVALAFTNANYGSSAANFDTLRTRISNSYDLSKGHWQYNYLNAGGSTSPLDLHTLDQAEALVFWLGGFPTPINGSGGNMTPAASRRLFGFHRDEDDPFKRNIGFESPNPMQFRTDPLFSFEEQRLDDIDGDGWLEYYPLVQRGGEKTSPYVYFDSYTYGVSTNVTGTGLSWRHRCYPRPDNNGVDSDKAKEVAELFGLAAPFAAEVDTARQRTTRWANPTGIQIVCGGLDGKFGPSISFGTNLGAVQRVLTFPKGEVLGGGDNYSSTTGMSREDMDNQSNLSNKTLEGARSEAAQ